MAEERYIKQYESHADMDADVLNGGINFPYVGYIENTNESIFGDDMTNEYFHIEMIEDGTITLTIPAAVPNNDSRWVAYAVNDDKDNNLWTQTALSRSEANVIEVNALAGDKVYWKGFIQRYATSTSVYSNFQVTGKFNVCGNIISLFRGDDWRQYVNPESPYCMCANLFNGNTTLINSNNLVLPTTLSGDNIYYGLFRNCSNLMSVPKMANVAGADGFSYMFAGTSIKVAPKVHVWRWRATGEYMFYNCPNLEDASGVVVESWTTVSHVNAYKYMFYNCVSLKKPFILSDEVKNVMAYNGFWDYTFYGCKSLVECEIPNDMSGGNAGGNHNLIYAFNGCSNMKYLRLMWKNDAQPCDNTFVSMPEYGKVTKSGAARWENNRAGNYKTIPEKWDVEYEPDIDISDNYQTLVFDMDEGDTMTYRVYAYPAPTVTVDSSYTNVLPYTMTTDEDNPNMHDITFSLGSGAAAGMQIPVVIGNDEDNFTVIVGLYDTSRPYDAEVEYIENTASEYINTEYVPTGTDIRIEGKIYPTSYSGNWSGWFGAKTNDNTEGFCIERNNNSNVSVWYEVGTAYNVSKGIVDSGVALNTDHEFDLSYGQLILDNTTYTYTPTAATTANTNPLYLFRSPQNTTYTRGKFYYLKVYKSDALVLDLIPVRRAGQGAMYDKVSGKVFTNAGTGTMGYGADVTSGE